MGWVATLISVRAGCRSSTKAGLRGVLPLATQTLTLTWHFRVAPHALHTIRACWSARAERLMRPGAQ
eukprot:4583017-Pyramimonas_sp.AAC.1